MADCPSAPLLFPHTKKTFASHTKKIVCGRLFHTAAEQLTHTHTLVKSAKEFAKYKHWWKWCWSKLVHSLEQCCRQITIHWSTTKPRSQGWTHDKYWTIETEWRLESKRRGCWLGHHLDKQRPLSPIINWGGGKKYVNRTNTNITTWCKIIPGWSTCSNDAWVEKILVGNQSVYAKQGGTVKENSTMTNIGYWHWEEKMVDTRTELNCAKAKDKAGSYGI